MDLIKVAEQSFAVEKNHPAFKSGDTVTIAYEDDTEQVFNKSDIALIRLALDF